MRDGDMARFREIRPGSEPRWRNRDVPPLLVIALFACTGWLGIVTRLLVPSLLLGLALVFWLVRARSGRGGMAVPAALSSAATAYVWVHDLYRPSTAEDSGWFLLIFGLSFIVMVLTSRLRAATWFLAPAALFTLAGATLLDSPATVALALVAAWGHLGLYWPVWTLVMVGWLWLRHRLAPDVRARLRVGLLGVLAIYAMLLVAYWAYDSSLGFVAGLAALSAA